MSARARRTWTRVLGALLLVSAAAHAFAGWPPMARALRAAAVDANIIAALSIGWLFGSAAMAAFGVLVLFSARGNGEREPLARRVVAVVGLTYLLFGAAAFAYRFPNPHFLFFIGMGAALCAAGLIGRVSSR